MVKLSSSYINFVVAQYIIEPKRTLKNWAKKFVNINCLNDFEYIYNRDFNKININALSKSNTIIAKLILKKHPDKINLCYLSENSSRWAYKLLDEIDWFFLSRNPSKRARKLLKNNPDKINSHSLSGNPSRWAYKLLDKNNSYLLSGNPSRWAYKLLDKIHWNYLSGNPSKWAHKLLKNNPDKIDWNFLLINPSRWAYKLLKNNSDKINWDVFSSNPYLFRTVMTNYKLFDVLLHKKLI